MPFAWSIEFISFLDITPESMNESKIASSCKIFIIKASPGVFKVFLDDNIPVMDASKIQKFITNLKIFFRVSKMYISNLKYYRRIIESTFEQNRRFRGFDTDYDRGYLYMDSLLKESFHGLSIG